jgi:2-keto-4-pentenoate hydratase
MTEFDPSRVATLLHEFRVAHQIVPTLPDEIAPQDEYQAAAAQYALATLTGATPPAGFKIGATSRRMQDYLGLTGPAAGFMAACGLLSSGATVGFDDFVQPGVECELAVRLGRDLPPGPCTREQASQAVAKLVAGIEIVENRYGDLKLLGTPTVIADQFYHATAVIGSEHTADWRDVDLNTLSGHMMVNGERRGDGRALDLLGHPMNCLAWLAASPVAAAFGGLKAGQVVMLGSVMPPIWLTGPSTVTVDFSPLPVVTVQLV